MDQRLDLVDKLERPRVRRLGDRAEPDRIPSLFVAFASSASLKDAMQKCGATSAPELSFVQGGACEA